MNRPQGAPWERVEAIEALEHYLRQQPSGIASLSRVGLLLRSRGVAVQGGLKAWLRRHLETFELIDPGPGRGDGVRLRAPGPGGGDGAEGSAGGPGRETAVDPLTPLGAAGPDPAGGHQPATPASLARGGGGEAARALDPAGRAPARRGTGGALDRRQEARAPPVPAVAPSTPPPPRAGGATPSAQPPAEATEVALVRSVTLALSRAPSAGLPLARLGAELSQLGVRPRGGLRAALARHPDLFSPASADERRVVRLLDRAAQDRALGKPAGTAGGGATAAGPGRAGSDTREEFNNASLAGSAPPPPPVEGTPPSSPVVADLDLLAELKLPESLDGDLAASTATFYVPGRSPLRAAGGPPAQASGPNGAEDAGGARSPRGGPSGRGGASHVEGGRDSTLAAWPELRSLGGRARGAGTRAPRPSAADQLAEEAAAYLSARGGVASLRQLETHLRGAVPRVFRAPEASRGLAARLSAWPDAFDIEGAVVELLSPSLSSVSPAPGPPAPPAAPGTLAPKRPAPGDRAAPWAAPDLLPPLPSLSGQPRLPERTPARPSEATS